MRGHNYFWFIVVAGLSAVGVLEPFLLGRDEGYIGVLIDDLVTQVGED